MLDLLGLIPAIPLAAFVLLALTGRRLGWRAIAAVGAGATGLSALLAVATAAEFLSSPPSEYAHSQMLWTWMAVADFSAAFGLRLDALALVMVLVVTVVGFLILWYSTASMKADDHGRATPTGDYARFFAYMNLFVAMMLVLVLADNLLLLYLGWEGVGLCSYLLIGFWHTEVANVRAAIKAFIVTRVGDVAMAIGLLLLFDRLGTLDIQELMRRASDTWPVGSAPAVAAALLLLGGAVGKSTQLPLQTWLPDAMAGPTPTSALIHAATMVTAGVYLIARTHVLFGLAPAVQGLVAIVGAATLLLAAGSALTQRDIKRVLAYSTMSQVGYMFLALGVGARTAAIFHLMTHAFFKALLFLGAGVVIMAMGGEHDMYRMGGLRHRLPLVFWSFLVGAASLSAVPLVTAGFYSKDAILAATWTAVPGGQWLWTAGVIGALLTSVYTFRMVLLTFFGAARSPEAAGTPGVKTEVSPRPLAGEGLGVREEISPRPLAGEGLGVRGEGSAEVFEPNFPAVDYAPSSARAAIAVPLVVLAALSIVGGLVETPTPLGHVTWFSDFLQTAIPGAETPAPDEATLTQLLAITSGVSLLGIYLAVWWYPWRARDIRAEAAEAPAAASDIARLAAAGWGFDGLYDRLFVRPYVWFARWNRGDFLDAFYTFIGWLNVMFHQILRQTETGYLRWYAAAVALGAVVAMAIMVMR